MTGTQILRRPGRGSRVLLVLIAAVFMAQLDLFVVNTILPNLTRAFPGSSLSGLSWTLNAYTICYAALLIPAGRLADQLSHRRVFLAGVALFTIGSFTCAAAQTLGELVASRCLQAVGCASLMPTSLGLLIRTFPSERHAKLVGLWAAAGGAAAAGGPCLAGVLVGLSWRTVFMINVPIGVAVVFVGRHSLAEDQGAKKAPRLDWSGALALLCTVLLIVVAIVQAPAWRWTSLWSCLCIGGALIGGAWLLAHGQRHPAPTLDLSLFRVKQFAAANAALAAFHLAFSSMLLVSMLYLSGIWQYSALRCALAFAPGPLAAMTFALNSDRLIERYGKQAVATIGALSFAAGCGWWLLVMRSHPAFLVAYLPGVILAGVGTGLTQAPLFGSVGALTPERAGTGSAMLTTTRQISTAIGVAVVVLLLQASGSHLHAFHTLWIFMSVSALITGGLARMIQ